MQVKNSTPFLFGARVTARAPRRPEIVLVVRGTYRLVPGQPLIPITDVLDQGFLTAETFAEDDPERAGACLYPGDFADWKPRADVMLRGACHPPGGRAARECPVRLRVGAFSKSLLVVGRRVWTEAVLGKAISDPQPFVSMPLDYAHAFGGPGYLSNPVGQGLGTPELPNVEDPEARIASKRDRPRPACFAPVNPAWSPRREKVGKEYGAEYQARRAPFYSADFDFAHFNAAPPDQQIPYLRGDEEVSFQNLHPDASELSVTLPALRVRALVKDDQGLVADVALVLDTLFADLEEGRLYLTWRGLSPVREDDLTDVKTVLVAAEPLAAEPKPAAHYRAVLEAFEADPLEIEQHMPGATAKLEALEAMAAERARRKKEDPEQDPVERALAAAAASLDRLPEAQRPQLAEAIGKLRDVAAKGRAVPAPAMDPGKAAASLQGILDRAKTLVGEARARGMNVPGVEALEKVLADPRVIAAAPQIAPPEAKRPPEPGPGVDLTGQDLRGRDLSGVDLTGAVLVKANLSEAKLVGARLAGANLEKAILREADLSEADLSGARLLHANLDHARAPRARFDGASLVMCILTHVDFTGASLRGVEGELLVLSGSDLTVLSGARLFKAVADGAVLERAVLDEADLPSCMFLRCRGRGASFERAKVAKGSFAESDWSGARFVDAKGETTSWLGATLDETDLSHAELPGAQFLGATITRTRLFGARLKGASFYRATLRECDASRADLYGASFGKAQIADVLFRGANLYDAKLADARIERCDLSRANLKLATLPRAEG